MADITMPQLGETVTEGTITKWFKQVGDQIAEDEVLFEVSTDKVDSEVPSPVAGYVTEILVGEGDTVPVGSKLAVIGERARATAAAGRPRPRGRCGGRRGRAGTRGQSRTRARDRGRGRAGARGRSRSRAREAAGGGEGRTAKPADKPSGDGRLLSPVVRRLIAEHNLDPGEIQGTGAGGRITRNDVLSVIEARGPAEAEPAEEPAAKAEPKAAEPEAAKAEPSPSPKRPRPSPSRRPRWRWRRRGARLVGPALQHPAPDGRAHGPLQGDVRSRLRLHRGRLRSGRAGARRPEGELEVGRGFQPHLPPVHRPRRVRRHRRVPRGERQLRRERADRPSRRQPGHRRRHGLQGADRPGDPRRPTPSGCGPSLGRSPTWPAGPAPRSSAPTRSAAARSPSPTRARSARR